LCVSRRWVKCMESSEAKISVIIPVYNTGSYLGECLCSIIHQTHHNIDILLIDDGSTDLSLALCDKASAIDPRIRVIHQVNGGLSRACNTGISLARGKYLSFIDSDDYAHPKMLEILLKNLIQGACDVQCCDSTSVGFKGLEFSKAKNQLFSNDEAISKLFDDNAYKCYARNKLYKKELFEKIRYSGGRLCEDIQTTHKIFKISKCIGYIRQPLYFYRIRRESITQSYRFDENRDFIDAINGVLSDSKFLADRYYDRLSVGYMINYLAYINLKLRNRSAIASDIEWLSSFLHSHWPLLFRHRNISIKHKIALPLYCRIVTIVG